MHCLLLIHPQLRFRKLVFKLFECVFDFFASARTSAGQLFYVCLNIGHKVGLFDHILIIFDLFQSIQYSVLHLDWLTDHTSLNIIKQFIFRKRILSHTLCHFTRFQIRYNLRFHRSLKTRVSCLLCHFSLLSLSRNRQFVYFVFKVGVFFYGFSG